MEEQLSVSFESAPVRVTSISTDGRTAAESVVEAVSAVAESDPGEMPPLSESIDPDVLDRVVERDDTSNGTSAGVCFTYGEWNVFVRGDGTVIITDPEEVIGPTPLF